MSDIVKRLRNVNTPFVPDDFLHEAADEIESLRNQIETVNYIASKASLTDEERLTDIRNYTSPTVDGEKL